jgi:solute carrier family 25 S-adenosylmethionine transporter 26
MIKGQGIKALFRSGGGRNLYAGVWGNLVGVAPASAVFMGIYEPVKAHITERVSPDKSFLGPLGAGAAAGFVASVIRVPTEVVKQRLQSGEFQRGAVDAVRNIIKHEGVRGLFAGYSSFMIRDLPFDAIEFVAYEQLKKAYKIQVSRELNPAETSAIGAIAGAVTGVATTPLDVVKTRLMTQGTSQRYKNVVDCFSKIIKEEGASTLLQGWQPRVIWIGLGGMVFFTALEEAKKLYAPKQFNHETL